jgi:TolA-binding protein
MRRRASRCAWLFGAALALSSVPIAGHAQVDSREGIALQNQIYQLRQDLQLLRADIARAESNNGGGGPGMAGDVAGQLVSRVQAMEEQVRQLRGRIDETQNLINRQNADLSKRIDDLSFQMNLQGKSGSLTPPSPALAQGPSGPSGPAPPPVREVAPRSDVPSPPVPPRLALTPAVPGVIPPPPPPPQGFTFNQSPEPMREPPPRVAEVPPPRVAEVKPPPEPARPPAVPVAVKPPPVTEAPPAEPAAAVIPLPADGKRTPEYVLQEGNAALARRDYPGAEKAAREIMANRASPRAYDGQFLLAQALSGQKQYSQAAIAYDDAYNRSHKGRHAQDALIGLATALTAINEKKAACDTLGKLRTEFPQVRADLLETITKTNQRAGCSG